MRLARTAQRSRRYKVQPTALCGHDGVVDNPLAASDCFEVPAVVPQDLPRGRAARRKVISLLSVLMNGPSLTSSKFCVLVACRRCGAILRQYEYGSDLRDSLNNAERHAAALRERMSKATAAEFAEQLGVPAHPCVS